MSSLESGRISLPRARDKKGTRMLQRRSRATTNLGRGRRITLRFGPRRAIPRVQRRPARRSRDAFLR